MEKAFIEQDLTLLGQRLLFAILWGAIIGSVVETGVPLVQRMRAQARTSAAPSPPVYQAGAGIGTSTAQGSEPPSVPDTASPAAAQVMTERTLAQFDSYDDMLELFTQYNFVFS
jgi:hypothetical protein